MVTHVIASSRSSALKAVDGGWTGDLPLRFLLADEVMQAALRSAGLTAAAFHQDFPDHGLRMPPCLRRRSRIAQPAPALRRP